MPSKLRSTIVFFIIQSASLVALSFISTYTLFSSNSGWQFGFGLILSVQAVVLALISTIVFGVSQNVYELTISCAKSAIFSGIVVVFSMLLSLPFGFFINGVGGFWLFHLVILIGALLAPCLIARYQG